MMDIAQEHLDDISAGAAFLATGGGGDPYLTLMSAKSALKAYGPASLIQVTELDDTATVVAIGAVGAPTTSLELLPSVDESALALEAFERLTGKTVNVVTSFEIGGGNSLIPIAAAAAHKVPVIDGDGMGRALPEATMMTYAIAGIHPTPAVLTDYAGHAELIEAKSSQEYESIVRRISMNRGGMALTVEFEMTGSELKQCIVPGTVGLARKIGRLLRSRQGTADQICNLLSHLFTDSIYGEFRHLFSGIVADMHTAVEGGYDVGTAIISPAGGEGSSLTIDIKNEYLTARLGNILLASVPDLICILDFETGQPINAERLRYGQRVTIVAIGCPGHYRTEAALEVVAPRCFGFDFDYIPLEQLPHH